MPHVSRWEKSAKKLVHVVRINESLYRVDFPSPINEASFVYQLTRNSARCKRNELVRNLTKILQQASKEAGF